MGHKQLLALFLLLSSISLYAQSTINLSGLWDFGTSQEMGDYIELPGSMPERMKGDLPNVSTEWTASLYDSSYYFNPYMEQYRKKENFKVPFFLTPSRQYVGQAWYHRTINLENLDNQMHYTIWFERPHITTTLWVNGKECGTCNSLTTPHEWNVTDCLQKGTNEITLRIDNTIQSVGVGKDSHSVSDQTQGNWNGVVGRMELRSRPQVQIDELRVIPNAKKREAKVMLCLSVKGRNISSKGLDVRYRLAGTNGISAKGKARLTQEKDTLIVELQGLGNKARLWDEFDPFVYRLNAILYTSHGNDTINTQFGIRDFEIKGRMFQVNGRPTLLRGTVENCNFPLTGYPPMDEQTWIEVFKKCKEFGLNHMRFHSYCPPEAAFSAADKVGFYLQPEGPSWPNHGVKLGMGQVIDTYLMQETQRIVHEYGNHPSFCMLSAGNEPAGNWVPWVSKFVDYWKKADTRRVYTGASVGGGWAWQPHSQYHVKAGVRGLDEWKKTAPESEYDFSQKLDTIRQPFVCHEMGQWCAFPDFKEVCQYTGVYKAKNFEIFQKLLEENGMGDMAEKFLQASGKLQVLCYKYEMERILRTRDYAGFQMLGINDYSGQGTALVGPLNVFFKEKGYVTPKEWAEFCSPTTVLCRLPKFTYWDDETIKGRLQISNFGKEAISHETLKLEIYKDSHLISTITPDEGEFVIRPRKMDEASKFTLRATLFGQDKQDVLATNHWDIWIYPRECQQKASIVPTGISVYSNFSDEAIKKLEDGGRVLIEATGNITYGKGIVQQFLPVFWNTSWFKMRPPHTTGLYVWNNHPVFKHFPTDFHSDIQWWDLVNNQQVMLLDHLPHDMQPLVQSIDTWFLNRKIGMMFEANVGKGQLLITTMPTNQDDYSQHPVAAQMRCSILSYMSSEDFKPQYTLQPDIIKKLFTLQTPTVNMFTKDMPDELKKKQK